MVNQLFLDLVENKELSFKAEIILKWFYMQIFIILMFNILSDNGSV